MMTGITQKFGPTALLRIGGVRVAVTTNRLQLFSLECPRALGLEPTALRWIGVKSSNHFRAAYGPIATQVHRVAFPPSSPTTPATSPTAASAAPSSRSIQSSESPMAYPAPPDVNAASISSAPVAAPIPAA